MHSVFVKLFTRSVLTDPEQGRTLIRLIGEHVPSWLPQRFGWSAPLRNVYDPDRFDEFWTGLEYNLDWRNAKRTAEGHVTTRVGPRDTLSSIELSGERNRALNLAGLAPLLRDCGQPLDLAYGLLHLFHPDDLFTAGHGGHLFGEHQGTPLLAVAERGLKECLPDVAWGNVFRNNAGSLNSPFSMTSVSGAALCWIVSSRSFVIRGIFSSSQLWILSSTIAFRISASP